MSESCVTFEFLI